ncbi:MAG: hypothetical protein KK482_08120 [Sinorhizobium meliloti]|nr:hypothetical protein [Sinorhizobium meliloti]
MAADTRRHDKVTKKTWVKTKLHRISDRLLIAQGGAGTGAADIMVDQLSQGAGGKTIDEAVDLCRTEGPKIIGRASKEWEDRGLIIPPTSIVLASVGEDGIGKITAVTLNNGSVFRAVGSYATGTHTAKSVEVMKKHVDKTATFDAFSVAVVHELENEHPDHIGLPVDVGLVIKTGETWECRVSRLERGDNLDPAFRL